jgi:hypothetical protein
MRNMSLSQVTRKDATNVCHGAAATLPALAQLIA